MLLLLFCCDFLKRNVCLDRLLLEEQFEDDDDDGDYNSYMYMCTKKTKGEERGCSLFLFAVLLFLKSSLLFCLCSRVYVCVYAITWLFLFYTSGCAIAFLFLFLPRSFFCLLLFVLSSCVCRQQCEQASKQISSVVFFVVFFLHLVRHSAHSSFVRRLPLNPILSVQLSTAASRK